MLTRRSLPLLLALLLAPAPALAQSASDLLLESAERYEQRMEGIENYTVVQTVMGFDATTYYERTEVDGRPVFVQRQVEGTESPQQVPDNPATIYRQLAEQARLEGSEEVDGNATHVIVIDDFSEVDMSVLQGPPTDQGQWTPESMTIWLDQEQLIPRRMYMDGTMARGGESFDIAMTLDFSDYREVEGMLHPFLMHISTDGMAEAMGMSEEELAQLQEQMEQMEQQMAQMPAQQREMMERMMGGQLDQMRQMLSSGSMDMALEVTELRVNAGPPEGDGGER